MNISAFVLSEYWSPTLSNCQNNINILAAYHFMVPRHLAFRLIALYFTGSSKSEYKNSKETSVQNFGPEHTHYPSIESLVLYFFDLPTIMQPNQINVHLLLPTFLYPGYYLLQMPD